MKKIVHLIVCAVCCLSATYAQNYTLKDITNGRFAGRGVVAMTSAADGEHYYQANRERSAVVKYSYATGLPVDTLFDARRARECTFDRFEGFLVSPDENRVLVYRDSELIYRHSFKATYYYHDVRRNLVRPLTQNTSKQMIPTFSPDSRMAAFVVDNNIWLAKFDFDTESQITTDGKYNAIINGSTDWVYEEEFGTVRLMEFSPDSKILAFVRSDESAVKEFQFQTYNKELYPGVYKFKYPKAGEANSKVECRVFDIAARTTRKLEVPLDADGYIPRIKFTNNPEELAVMTLNRNQNRFDMYLANTRSTVAKLLLREESKYYVDSEWLKSIHFMDNQFVYVSEKDGFSHIYLYGMSGTLQRQLTSGNFDVTALLAVDNASKTLYYEAADESPLRRNIYKVSLLKGAPQKLSTKSGYNSASFSTNGKYYVNRWTTVADPTEITLHNNTGKQIRVLEQNAQLRQTAIEARLPQKELITVTAADGKTSLNGWILKPFNFDASKRYPLVLVQYSGPNSQQVYDRFGVDWYHALAKEDIIVACIDGRGTGARGEEFRKCTYLNLGIFESDDQIAAARQLGNLAYVDSNRMGIWGWSYGGYNVLMSMSRGDGTFRAGVAIAPVSDWRYYDTVYAERFMRTPQQNADGYDKGSALLLANQLQGNLLLIHGTSDDNVHIQNAVEYSRALIAAGKHFDMFYFPDKNHSIYGENVREYLYEKVIHYFKTNL